MKTNVLFLACCFISVQCSSSSSSNISETVNKLFEKIRGMQATKTTQPAPPIEWAKFKGNYESDVKLYFHGNASMSAMRYLFKVYDNNMFATAWITSCLIEAYRYGSAPKPTEEQLIMSIDAIMEHRNKNLKYPNSIMAFWPQIFNEEYKVYQSTPVNILSMFDLTLTTNWTEVYETLDKLGLHDIKEIIEHLLRTREGYKHVFKIPPDFDDTAVNLGLGTLLKDNIQTFPYASTAWQAQNSNLSSVFNALKHYAYRPLSGDRRVNTIDPRTYVYMRKFLEKAQQEKRDVSLVSTWVQDLVDVKTEYYQGIDIPGNVNNVDITVCANALFGITNAILSGLVTSEVLDDPVLQQLYLNTSSMIEFQIQTNFSGRPELALTYYPSVFEFYWFVGRTYTQLERKDRLNELPHQVMKTVMEGLGNVLKGNMTDHVISEAKMEGTDMIYFDDFLGDGDVDNKGNKVMFGEDRMWTTSMAINALITTWTVFNDSTSKLNWYIDTPEHVKVAIQKAVTWLNTYILSGKYQPWNAFFSGSAKGYGTSWSEYPANRDEFFNGTKIPEGKHYYGATIRGMEGVMPEDWYEQQTKIRHSPIDFHGFNNQSAYFPFWNSEPYTYVTSLLALSTYTNIQ